MATWTVTSIVDGDTFKVTPNWTWNDETGDTVRPTGYNAPEQGKPGHQQATDKLRGILLGKQVDLKNCVRIDRGRLVCAVYVGGKNLADYFPEYQ